MAQKITPTRDGGYPWHKYASGEWHAVRETPPVLAALSGKPLLADYLAGRPWYVAEISPAMRLSATKWARRRAMKAETRTDSTTGKFYVRFTKR